METWVVATGLIFLYLLVTIVLGIVANRRLTVDLEDFLLYGRRAGFIVLYLTVVATYHSAFAFLGSGGFFYRHGIGFWDAGTWTVLVGAITYVLGSRIWALGKKFGYITPADMLADFYESEAVRVVVALVSVVFTILYIQVQAQGLGYIINVASGERISLRSRDRRLVGRGGRLPHGRRAPSCVLDRRRAGRLDVHSRVGRRARGGVQGVWGPCGALGSGPRAASRSFVDARSRGLFHDRACGSG